MLAIVQDKYGHNRRIASIYSYEYYNDNQHDSSFNVEGLYKSKFEGGTYEGGLVIVTDPEIGEPHVSLITAVTPSNEGDPHTDFSTSPIIKLFDRSVYWDPTYDGATYSAIVSDIITKNWGSGQTDPMFFSEWLYTSLTSDDIANPPESLDDAGYFNFYSWLKDEEKRLNYILYCYPYEKGVLITDAIESSASSTIFFESSDFQLISETYSADRVSKITNHVYDDGAGSWSEHNYYLKQDGTYSVDVAPEEEDRIDGKWEHMVNKDENDVKQKFNENKYEHKIIFYATKNWLKHSGEKVIAVFKDGDVVESVVTCVCQSSEYGNYIKYELGNLPTTLFEIVKDQNGDAKVKASSDTRSVSSGISGSGSTSGGLTLVFNRTVTSGMDAQTITESHAYWKTGKKLKDYWAFLMFFRGESAFDTEGSLIVLKNGRSYTAVISNFSSSSASNNIYRRRITATNSGITISTGYRQQFTRAGENQTNMSHTAGTNYCIPTRIYGIS